MRVERHAPARASNPAAREDALLRDLGTGDPARRFLLGLAAGAGLLTVLYGLSRYSYALFHSAAEGFVTW